MAVRLAKGRGGAWAGVLDIGTGKVVCLIAELLPPVKDQPIAIRVLGIGHQRSRGIKAGVVTHAGEAEAVIRAAVSQAERSAGLQLEDVFVSLTSGRLASLSFAAHAAIGPDGVTSADIDRLMEGARAYAEREGRALIHMNRRGYRLDGLPAGDDPRGLAAAKLTADIHAVTADDGAVRNLIHVVERCHLSVAGLIAAPYASALAVTTPSERLLGATVVDMGDGTTTLAAFGGGQLLRCAAYATGGHHLTFDIAQNLRTTLAEAERIKTLYASMVNAQSDVCDRISYSPADDSDGGLQNVTRAHLAGIVQPRITALLQSIAGWLDEGGSDTGQIVLTGGACELAGLGVRAAEVFGRAVRIGCPGLVAGLPSAARGPAFSAPAGLALAVFEAERQALAGQWLGGSYVRRLGYWLKSGF